MRRHLEQNQQVVPTGVDDSERVQQRKSRVVALQTATVACVLIAYSVGNGQESLQEPPKADDSLFSAADFDKEFEQRWIYFAAPNGVKRGDIWKASKGATNNDDVLVCMGKPFGYIRTKNAYENYEFALEWKYPKEQDGNSGILIHTTGKDQIWPKSIQVQLHAPKAGSVFAVQDARTDNKVDATGLSKPMDQWNSCVITCKKGSISVVINGKKAGEVTGCMPSKGTIALQSEGSEVHFRRIRLRKLK